MKPVLQALVLADHVYTDKSGKKIIAGTFNQIVKRTITFPDTPPPETGKQMALVPGGTDPGCPWCYLSITDVLNGTELSLQFVNRGKNEVLFETSIKIEIKDRLATVEVAMQLPPLARMLNEPGEYSFDVISEGELLGSHRLIYKEVA